MIVANLERGAGSPFLVRDFRNIAGKAGRALHETEGNVIFIQNTQSSWLVAQKYRYLRDDKIEKVQSVLFDLYSALIQRKLGISLDEFLVKERERFHLWLTCNTANPIGNRFSNRSSCYAV